MTWKPSGIHNKNKNFFVDNCRGKKGGSTGSILAGAKAATAFSSVSLASLWDVASSWGEGKGRRDLLLVCVYVCCKCAVFWGIVF